MQYTLGYGFAYAQWIRETRSRIVWRDGTGIEYFMSVQSLLAKYRIQDWNAWH